MLRLCKLVVSVNRVGHRLPRLGQKKTDYKCLFTNMQTVDQDDVTAIVHQVKTLTAALIAGTLNCIN